MLDKATTKVYGFDVNLLDVLHASEIKYVPASFEEPEHYQLHVIYTDMNMYCESGDVAELDDAVTKRFGELVRLLPKAIFSDPLTHLLGLPLSKTTPIKIETGVAQTEHVTMNVKGHTGYPPCDSLHVKSLDKDGLKKCVTALAEAGIQFSEPLDVIIGKIDSIKEKTKVEYEVTRNWVSPSQPEYEKAGAGIRLKNKDVTAQRAPGPSKQIQDIPRLAHRQFEHPVVLHIYNPPEDILSADKLGRIAGAPKKEFVGEFERDETMPEAGYVLLNEPGRLSLTVAKGRFAEAMEILDITMQNNKEGHTDKSWVEFVKNIERGAVHGK